MDTLDVRGTLAGHVLPGAMFIAWALLWMGEAVLRRDDTRPGRPLESGPALPIAKIVLPLIGVWVEIPGHRWYPADVMMNWQHVTMYSVFSLSGIVDLLVRRGALFPGAGHVAFASAHANAAFLFWGHGRHPGVPGLVHLLLAATFLAVAGAAVLELLRPSRGATWARRGALLAVGAWFMCVGWILYASGWDLQDPVREGWFYLVFSWIMVTVAVVTVTARLLARPVASERSAVSRPAVGEPTG